MNLRCLDKFVLRFAFSSLLVAGPGFVLPAMAQVETAQVTGTVTDNTGAVIPNATVVARNADTGFTRTVVTTGAGLFSAVELPAGPYVFTITAPSFGTFEQKITLTVGQPFTLNAKLGVTDTTVVSVGAQSDVAALNTTTNEVSQVITPEQIVNLPSLTRNPYDFVALSGNVSSDPGGSTQQGAGVSLGGGRASGTDVLLDGVENLNLYSQTVGQTIPLDSVQEYRIITSGFDARYGRATGGIVNLTTKTGTNSFHGSAYEYNRISALASNTHYEDAANYVRRLASKPNNPADHFVRNQFGYSIGGPIKKDKLFFFSNTEWIRIRSSATQNNYIPTNKFLLTTSQQTQAFFTQYGSLRPGAVTGPTADITYTPPTGPAVVFPNAIQQVTYVLPATTTAGTPQNTYFTLDRIDYTLSQKTNMYFRYALYSQNAFAGSNAYSPFAGFDTGSTAYDQAGLFSLTHLFGANLIDVSKISYSRDNEQQPLGTNPAGPTLYALGSAATINGLQLALPGYLPFNPGSAIPFGGPQNFYQFTNDLEYIKGRNDFHFGGDFDQLRDNRTFGAYENSVNTLSGKNTGDAFNNMVIGHLYSFSAAIYPQGELPCANNLLTGSPIVTPACTLKLPLSLPNFERENTFNDGSAYGQDSLKVTNNLTVTAGLRWEYFGVQHNHDPNLESNFFLGSGSTYQAQFRAGNLLTTPNSPIGGLYQKQFHNFSPRFGFAYDVFGNGKDTVRGGYGISYERNYGNVTYNVIQNPPNYAVVSLTASDAGGGDVPTLPITTSNFGPLAGASGSKAFPATSLRPVQQNIPTAYQQNYNLSVAHSIARGALVELTYAGARGIHLYSIANVNRLWFGGNYLGDTRAINRLQTQYTAANLRGANGDSYYNSLNIRSEYDRFAANGLHFTANYTLGRSLDDNSSTFDTGNGSSSPTGFLGYLDPFNPRSSFGNSDFDVRHRLALSAIYTPRVLERHGTLLRETLGGLNFAPIIVARSGAPFTVFDNSNTDTQATPNIVPAAGLKYHGTSVLNGGTNTYNYIQIPLAAKNLGVNPINGKSDLPCTPGVNGCTFTNGMDRNQFYGPLNYSVNLGAYKTFTVFERYRLQFRGEFYNLFNHANQYVLTGAAADYNQITTKPGGVLTPGYIQTSKGTSTPGNLGATGSQDERRNVQLALRFEF